MANNIRGITIEIGGNTAPLDKALKEVNKSSRDLQIELREVNKQLKLDPTNTVLLEQKQKLLSESVINTKIKLDSLKAAEKQVQQQFKEGKVSEEQYRALQREVIKVEGELKKLEKQASNSNIALSKIHTTAGKVSEVSGQLSSKMMPATIAITGLGVAATKMGSDFIESMNKVDVAFKDNAKEVKEWSNTTLDNFGISSGTALDMSSLYGDMGTAMGQTTDEAAKMSMSLVGLAGDLASFKNIGINQAQDALKGIFTGEGEALKTLGIVMQESTLKEYALSKGIKTKYEAMTQAEKVSLRYNFVMDKTKNAQGDFARTSDGAANSMRVASESAKEAAASIGVMLAPIIAKAAQYVSALTKGFAGLDERTKKIILIILAIIAAIAPLAGLISGIATMVGAATTVMSTAFLSVAAPVIAVVAAIGGLIAIFVLLYKNNEDFRNNVNETWSKIKELIGTVVEQIKILISEFVTVAKEVWEKYGDDITRVAKAAFEVISTIVQTYLKIVIDVIKIFTALLKGDWSAVWEGIQKLTQDIWEGIKNILGAAIEYVKSLFKLGFKILADIVSGCWDNIKKLTKSAWDAVYSFITDPIGKVASFVEGVFEKVSSVFSKIKDKIANLFTGIKIPHINVNVKWGGPGDAIPYPSFDVNWYDKGGIFSAPTIIGVGEKRPEFVGALDDLRGIVRDVVKETIGNNNPLFGIQNFYNNRKEDIQALVEEVEFYRKQASLARGG